MSTKINVRSPFYLNLTEPTATVAPFDCIVANLQGFDIDNQGVITEPVPEYGTILSYTSSDPDFSNGKFTPETNDTVRTVTFTVSIPLGFPNSSDLTIPCSRTITQPGTVGSVAPCTGGPTTSGTIPNQTLNSGGATVDINLSSYFTNETVYAVNNTTPLLVNTALSGSTLTISSNAQAGSATVYAIGRDANYPTTCEAVQEISITVNATGITFSCTVPVIALQGGSIAQDGTITRPNSSAVIQGVSLTDGGTLLNPETVSANAGSTAQNVTLFFKLLVPVGYDNAGASIYCENILSQAGTTLPTFTCGIAGLTGQQISEGGAVFLGTALNGTVKSFTQPNPPFGTVTTNTTRTVEFQVEIPSGYINAGTEINCPRELIQPATTIICGTHTFYITFGQPSPDGFCLGGSYSTSTEIKSTEANIASLINAQICTNSNVSFSGKNLYYAISTSNINIGAGTGGFYVVQISNQGIVIGAFFKNCSTSGSLLV